ncbi:hypothetical protein SEA_DUDELITTLE_89 [Mycobacterium phage DudeLittle]|uniref:Uncharacterized protein n=1 Tax=Mycobacterium phage Anselm TaxID=2041517 RepID=A0A2D1G5D6_9CAUD|nr:hypothetical protein KIY79_gp93 [Mycobacterium phage Anselm]AOQ28207.1 hypothetical protein SEA_DUDELITTLE_89 [Mycobacterium phage DudeLittle]ATN87091.1 hypothetical protein SEA_ANSELM_93 [Mycobacterium phage Anselm]QGJ89038.1 hypothetical protein SEA_QUEENB2_89 [Mycobacterium phage QueenB2]QGJ89228.1 hypothetical protein SEA_RETRO23_91 [Mycobacterium phage Retro23]
MSYERQEQILRDEIEELNRELGLTEHKITFGYIGNGKLTSNGWDLSDCLWMVFLPHPGRVGKEDDRLGGFKTGSLEGIVEARRALKAFGKGARFAKGL